MSNRPPGAMMLALMLAGCQWPSHSGPNMLPDLVTVYGRSMLPDDYVVQASTQPAPRTFRVMLASTNGLALATAALTDDAGDFALNVPVSSLKAEGALYEVALIEPRRPITFRAMLKLSASTQQSSVLVDATSTAITLAAEQALKSGANPANWNFQALEQNPSLQTHCLPFARAIARWSNGRSGITTAESSAAPAPDSSLIAEVIQDAQAH